jgi:L-xylulokinase
MKHPVETVDIEETGALGCAMTAAVAVGEFKNFEEAACSMIKVKQRVEPNLDNAAVYEKKYALYKQVISALDGIWDNMQKLM